MKYSFFYIASFVGLLLAIFLLISHQGRFSEDDGDFIAILTHEQGEFIFNTESFYIATFSSYSIYAETDKARCGIHITNIKNSLEIGSYKIGSQDSINPTITCVVENPDQRERVDAKTGEVIIIEISPNRLTGRFQAEMVGAVTGNKYSFSGEFTSHYET